MNYYKLSLDDKIGIAGIAIVNARRDPDSSDTLNYVSSRAISITLAAFAMI
jgi:hypothetical protein